MASMHPAGLFPDSSSPGRPKISLVLAAVVFTALVALLGALLQLRRLARERDEAVESLVALRKRSAEPAPKPVDAAPRAPESSPAAPGPAPSPPVPGVSVAGDPRPSPPRPIDPQHLAQGLQEFRAGRYDQAERRFFRAFPDSLVYLALTSLAQANYREAIGFLGAAMSQDPTWLRRVKPADLFGSKAAYHSMVSAIEEALEKDPINPDLKTLLAYLRYHDKGAPYAKALLVEATNADPEHEAAKAFLDALGP
jgi:tetratricopeptide (TPR) repeat protein